MGRYSLLMLTQWQTKSEEIYREFEALRASIIKHGVGIEPREGEDCTTLEQATNKVLSALSTFQLELITEQERSEQEARG